jgi:hypothetical protein
MGIYKRKLIVSDKIIPLFGSFLIFGSILPVCLRNIMKAVQTIIILAITILFSCSRKIKKEDFSAFLSQPCMILNYQQDNSIEGNYITIKNINPKDSIIEFTFPKNFLIKNSNFKNWIVGWGNEKPFYDAGNENLRKIKNINNGTISLGSLVRGNGFPKKGQRIVFWNTNPSGFVNERKRPVIDPGLWPGFAGKSISFGSIEYDDQLNKWIIIVNECDTSKIQIYAAMSSDLVNWEAANNGNPILSAADFKSCKWAGRDKNNTIDQAPFVSDIVRYKKKWYLFLDGYSKDGKRHIGIATSEKSLLGPYKISENPVLSPGKKGSWNDESCFYAKVEKYNNAFIMFYDGKNRVGIERIGMATSDNLTSWNNSASNPVIDEHTGWRSATGTTEPAYIEIRKDSILLMIEGAKKLKAGLWNRFITKRMNLDKSGNVADAELGIYLSTDGGKTFIAHKNNPVFTNDYSNVYENDHLGGNFRFIKTDSLEYIFYQAKSNFDGLKYNIMLRQRRNGVYN